MSAADEAEICDGAGWRRLRLGPADLPFEEGVNLDEAHRHVYLSFGGAKMDNR